MPDLTPRLQLKKPVADGSETADLRVWVGENMDLLDVAIGYVEDKADAAGQAAATAQQTTNAAQQAASAAQAAASTAQSTADGAASAAASAQSTADAAQAAITNHAARTDNPHGVTAAQLGAANILAQIKTVDGSGSGLDADTVDGEDAASLKANARALSTAKLIAEVKSSAPSSPVNGQIWYDAANHKFRGYANGAWV